jgi:hypothetical protein
VLLPIFVLGYFWARYVADHYIGDSWLAIAVFALGVVIVVALLTYWVNRDWKSRL